MPCRPQKICWNYIDDASKMSTFSMFNFHVLIKAMMKLLEEIHHIIAEGIVVIHQLHFETGMIYITRFMFISMIYPWRVEGAYISPGYIKIYNGQGDDI